MASSGYVGGSLVDFVQAAKGAPVDRAVRNIAQVVGSELTTRAALHTPVGRTGSLARKWRSLPVLPAEGGGWVSGTENPDHRALWIEYGVEPHRLKPRRRDDAPDALDTPEGPRGSADHPGFVGVFPLHRAMHEVEGELEVIAQPAVSAWAAESEARAKRHTGID